MRRILNLLAIIPFWGYRKIKGWLSSQEAIGLYKVATLLPENATVVEIGSWQGKSTYCILSGLKSGKVHAIDPFNASGGEDWNEDEYQQIARGIDLLETFKMNVKKFIKSGQVVVRKGFSNQFKDEFETINFLFIDGDHSIKGCQEDYELYAHKIVKGGYIAFHDYHPGRPELGPTHVINEVINKENLFSYFARYDSLWIGVRN
jgi:predicted O-methyltransferase YrrM